MNPSVLHKPQFQAYMLFHLNGIGHGGKGSNNATRGKLYFFIVVRLER
jgi:hypothetical protein